MRYCIVTAITAPRHDTIRIHWQMRDDTAEPDEVLERHEHDYTVDLTLDYAGNLARMRSEIDRLFDRTLAYATAVESNIDRLRADGVGYRRPPVGG